MNAASKSDERIETAEARAAILRFSIFSSSLMVH
jgi:hypothetical protein